MPGPSLSPDFNDCCISGSFSQSKLDLGSHIKSPPHDDGTFRRSLQIDMKSLVGDAVGSMSISPTSRDVVLAARSGLFIIDLQAPFEVPRFLPQGGTWDVADVQWNTHPSRSEYIVSTSSEKLLIWNLLLVGKSSIEHILSAHQRTVTDINWAINPDLVASTGIDSWIWAWDLREPRKPIFGFSAFNAGGTQVKWNRKDENILASSHSKEVLIWDRRKGSLPLSRIKAHNSKIYGIDWSHDRKCEIVTCSLDKTIKIWDVSAPTCAGGLHQPIAVICTTYPVWRARDLPFGQGILSLPQRGATELEMWTNGKFVEKFVGHSDVVKEFVWRRGGLGDSEFQLITWSKDRTLRFWPIDSEVMARVSYTPIQRRDTGIFDGVGGDLSFRNPPEGNDCPPALSVPVGHRSILAEVRAPVLSRHMNPVMQSYRGSAAREESVSSLEKHVSTPISMSPPTGPAGMRRGGTMSRGYTAGRSARVDTFMWLSNVKVDERRENSVEPDNVDVSRLGSTTRHQSGSDCPTTSTGRRRGSGSRSRTDDRREGDGSQSLQDEITSVLTKLASSRIKLEKIDLTKKRTCTLGLHGPWGESSSVFMRISFTFPRDYPQAQHPDGGTPSVDLENSPLMSMTTRAFVLRRVKLILEQRRPCLEACLRFLLFASEDEDVGMPASIYSSENDEGSREETVFTVSLLQNTKNLAEPRTSQGVFGPNGDLVCFFHAPPRIVRKPLHNGNQAPCSVQSPALLFDAVRRLETASVDYLDCPTEGRRDNDGGNILRIMTNLLTFSQLKSRRSSDSSKPSGDMPPNYSLLPSARSTVFVSKSTNITESNRKAASAYVYSSTDVATIYQTDANCTDPWTK